MIGEHTLQQIALLLCTLWLQGCTYEIEDIDKVQERMELQSNSAEIALNADQLTADILTFNWLAARTVEGENMVSYRTKLDVEGNNFGSATAIMSHEDEGVLTKSFSSEQLQNWANEKWGLPVNQPFNLQFRVIAQYEGSAAFHAPEVRTMTVRVQPIRTVAFDADEVFVGGTSLNNSGASIKMSKTLENENQYALLLDLQAGDLHIPVSFDGETNYICPSNSDGTLHDGEAVPVNMREKPIAWKIPTAGQYRVVINMQKATVALYSPARALTAKQVTWNGDAGASMTTSVSELWMHGAINGWGRPSRWTVA